MNLLISVLLLKNLMSPNVNSFVFLLPGTAVYSQLLIPKNRETVVSSPIAFVKGVVWLLYICSKTSRGRHF